MRAGLGKKCNLIDWTVAIDRSCWKQVACSLSVSTHIDSWLRASSVNYNQPIKTSSSLCNYHFARELCVFWSVQKSLLSARCLKGPLVSLSHALFFPHCCLEWRLLDIGLSVKCRYRICVCHPFLSSTVFTIFTYSRSRYDMSFSKIS